MLLSHIIAKRFSREYENIATDALAFMLDNSDAAKAAFCGLLRLVESSLPDLQFKTQESDDNARPDLWGMSDGVPRVFVENKFWAGLTDNQPVTYLHRLASGKGGSLLIFIVPSEREETIWGELKRRIAASGFGIPETSQGRGVRSMRTEIGPTLALTSWHTVLSTLESAMVTNPIGQNDLQQLRALWLAADDDAMRPLSIEMMSDQDVPRLLASLSGLVQDAIDRAAADGFVSLSGLKPQADWMRAGRYLRFSPERVAWVGIHTTLWRKHGVPRVVHLLSGI